MCHIFSIIGSSDESKLHCQTINEFADNCLHEAPDFSSNLYHKSIEITEPNCESDRVVRFLSELIIAIPFSCTLRNFDGSEFDALRIRVRFVLEVENLTRL